MKTNTEARKRANQIVFGGAKIGRLTIEDFGRSEEYVSIGDDYAVPREFWASVVPSDARQPVARLLVDSSTGDPICRELRLEAREGGVVSPASLRKAQVGAYLREATTHAARRFSRTPDDQGEKVTLDGSPAWVIPLAGSESVSRARRLTTATNPRMKQSGSGVKISDDHLQEVARYYKHAVESGTRAPTASLAKTFKTTRPTMSRWIRMARDAGHLGPATNGKAG